MYVNCPCMSTIQGHMHITKNYAKRYAHKGTENSEPNQLTI